MSLFEKSNPSPADCKASPTSSITSSFPPSDSSSFIKDEHYGMLAPKPSDGTRSRRLKAKIFARDVITTVNPVVILRKLHKRFSKPKGLRGEIKAPPTVLNDVKLSDREILAINLSVARGELYVINKRICELHESWKKLEADHYVSYPSSLPHPVSHPPSR